MTHRALKRLGALSKATHPNHATKDKEKRGDVMTLNWTVAKPNWYTTGAWRAAQEPEAIAQAVEIGEQIADLLTEAAGLIERAGQDVDSIVDNAVPRCQMILDRLTGEADRLAPVLTRLRAASKAVRS